jgi:hypothetical protein
MENMSRTQGNMQDRWDDCVKTQMHVYQEQIRIYSEECGLV